MSDTEEPLCIACKEYVAYYDPVRKAFSKYCTGECQKALEAYNTAVEQIKSQVAQYPLLMNHDDFPPPYCRSCPYMGSRCYDYAQKKYIDNCCYCVNAALNATQASSQYYPAQQTTLAPVPAPIQQQLHQQFGNSQQQYVQATPSAYQSVPQSQQNDQMYRPSSASVRPGPAQVAARLKNRLQGAQKTIPSESASRIYYQRPNIANQGNLCAHCFTRPASSNTNMGLFCNPSCEQAESKVAGCGVLVMSIDYHIVVLSYMNSGPYKGKWSLLHDTKNVQELGRDCCVRIASTVDRSIAPNAQDYYCMVEHSTPNVFSYSVLVARDPFPPKLQASQDIANGGFIHVSLGQFYNKPVTGDICVMDINHKQRIVSRHTHKVINEFVNLLTKKSGYTS